MGRALGMHTEKRKAQNILVGRPEGKIRLGRPRHKWNNNIKVDLRDRMGGHGQD